MRTRYFSYRWLVVCDDEARSYKTRSAAKEAARSLQGHPANANIRAFGPYKNVDGEARVIDLGSPDEDGEYRWEPEEAER